MIKYSLIMSKTEVKPITVHVLDLQEGETVADANITHTPPGGNALDIPSMVDTPYINMVFGPFGVVGIHYVKVQAVGNAPTPSKPEVLYEINVKDAGN